MRDCNGDPAMETPAPTPTEFPTRLSRSPHPYHRRSLQITPLSLSGTDIGTDAKNSAGSISSPNTPTSPFWDCDSRKRRKNFQFSQDTGSDADDEKAGPLLSLPPAPIRPRKGLKDASLTASPLLTPRLLDEEPEKQFLKLRGIAQEEHTENLEGVSRRLKEKFRKKRLAELFRRVTETTLFGLICFISLGRHAPTRSDRHEPISSNLLHLIESPFQALWPLRSATYVSLILYALYPVRIILKNHAANAGSGRSRLYIHLPAAFDPSPLLYPIGLPVMVSYSIYGKDLRFCMLNSVLALGSLPPKIIPLGQFPWYYSPQWLLSLVPDIISGGGSTKSETEKHALSFGRLGCMSYLFPLHRILLPNLYFLATSSLLPSEYQLLSVALINLLILSTSPQSQILYLLLWWGGISIFVFCAKVMSWEVALARIPTWRFRSPQMLRQQKSTLPSWMLRLWSQPSPSTEDSSPDDDDMQDLDRTHSAPAVGNALGISGLHPLLKITNGAIRPNAVLRSLTGAPRPPNASPRSKLGRAQRSSSPFTSWALRSLTAAQAQSLRWAFASYVYAIVLLVIGVLLRPQVAQLALAGSDPVGWSLGYLFGDMPLTRNLRMNARAWSWIILPEHQSDQQTGLTMGVIDTWRWRLGAANMRLVLSAYCASVIVAGLLIVLQMRNIVEVDTRRKVFHGMMVMMFLPTVFVDPCFVALALTLVLAIFLLLDLFRAAQLPPLAGPLTQFLAPYVDGRDHRGPVIVSHIFLLIGCAIPLWLSLGAETRAGKWPWAGWDVAARDLSMISGIVCVGMGDAAASLIGRRFGRRRWCWTGGKSFEGSAAFALAVLAGLTVSRAWLYIGGWPGDSGDGVFAFLTKGSIAACGASLTEAVLTGGNDNVIVPIVLWLLVRGLNM